MHVSIPNYVEKRKDILKSAIDSLQIEKKCESLKEAKKEVLFYTTELRKTLRLANKILRELEVPKIRTVTSKKEIKEVKPVKEFKEHKAKDKYEDELKKLRLKISSL